MPLRKHALFSKQVSGPPLIHPVNWQPHQDSHPESPGSASGMLLLHYGAVWHPLSELNQLLSASQADALDPMS